MGLSNKDFEIWFKGALEVERLSLSLSLSLSGSSVNGTWREGYLAGDHGGYVENSLETGISFHMGLIGESGEGLIYWRH